MEQKSFQWNFDNHRLFSDHYLENRVPENERWSHAHPDEAFRQLIDKWEEVDLDGANEAQTERRWIRPVLDALGHEYCVQTSLETPRSTRQPDYFLFDADDAPNLAEPVDESTLAEHGAIAVADAKRWQRDLDETADADDDPNENPSLQIDFYVRHSGLDWGILTNGREWRLYHRDSSRKLEVFYQVDLPELLQQGDLEAFKYFWLFFHRAAFVGERCWLDRILEESEAYQQGVGEDLEEQVYEALQHLAQGFVDYPNNDLDPTDPEKLEAIHDHSLIVLYRMLFTLYAESRGLLPMEKSSGFDTEYKKEYSFHQLKHAVRRKLKRGEYGAPTRINEWSDLKELWNIIAEGDDYLDVPVYNGGLFDSERYPFLEEHAVGDRALRRAIDLLARADDPHGDGREFVDYRDLDVRNLGSIYEGLLEYKLRYADTPLTVDREDGTEVYAEAESDDEVEVEFGDVYLETDKGERKATGSYYTPGYIVEYIVEHTVGPVLDDLRESYTNDDGEVTDRRGLAREILELDVLDPAMGSGHFLVEATDYIARELVDIAGEFAEPDVHETELSYWQRRVAQACIYGVDVNPLAVELAKLSLWLKTAAYDKPLSFLDHHLRCGNSLIGADVRDLPLQRDERPSSSDTSQMSLLEDSAFSGSMADATRWIEDIEQLTGETLEDIKEAERLYERTVDEATATPRLLADVYTARHFGLDVDEDSFAEMAKRVLHGTFDAVPAYREIRDEAEAIGEEKRFFHWELEFPEVFFDADGNYLDDEAGFDAVVGNPPWVNSQDIAGVETEYYRERYDTAEGKFDLYSNFTERGLEVTRQNGLLSFIVSNKFLRSDYGGSLRDFLSQNVSISKLVDFADLPLFGDAINYSLILEAERNTPSEEHIFEGILFENDLRVEHPKSTALQGLKSEDHDYSRHIKIEQSQLDSEGFWDLVSLEATRLLDKIEQQSSTLNEYCEAICQGAWTGKKEAFIHSEEEVNTDNIEEELLKPVVDGRNVDRYFYDNCGKFIIYPYTVDKGELKVVNIENYPNTFRLLSEYRNELEERRNWGETILKAGKEWYELWNPSPLLQRPKILVQDIADSNRFALDEEGGYLAMNTCYALILEQELFLEPWALLALLNSDLLTFEFQSSSSSVQGGFYRYKTQYLEDLSIRDITFTLPEEKRAQHVDTLVDDIESARDGGAEPSERAVLETIDNHLAADPPREDIVHDVLADLAREMTDLHERRARYDLDVLNYVGERTDGLDLPDIGDFQPADDTGPLAATADDLEKLKIGSVRVRRTNSDAVTIEATARYKPDDPEGHDLDQWGYTETDWFEAFELFELDDAQAALIEHFVPAAADRGDGFAGFRDNATKTISPLERIKSIELPDLDRVQDDLRRFVEAKSTADELDRKIAFTDELIDQIVYRLYGLTDEEIEIVEAETK